MTACAIHISDLHRGTHEAPELDDALVTLCHELQPELVIASGDLSNRCRPAELEEAKALLDRLQVPTLAVPGNHDIPYTLPARVTSPWQPFEAVFGTTDPVLRTPNAVVCGLNSGRPWRHQGGRLDPKRLASVGPILADAPPGALRIVVCHHHLAGAPWRASRKFPLKHRNTVLRTLAAAGAELVLGGHIHQATAVERHSFQALADEIAELVGSRHRAGLRSAASRPARRGQRASSRSLDSRRDRDRDADLAGRPLRARTARNALPRH